MEGREREMSGRGARQREGRLLGERKMKQMSKKLKTERWHRKFKECGGIIVEPGKDDRDGFKEEKRKNKDNKEERLWQGE